MATDKHHRLQDALDKLSLEPGVDGAVLVTRDGFCTINRFRHLGNPDVFSAMSAALVGAAEAALHEAGAPTRARVVVEAGNRQLLITPAGDGLLLVVMASLTLPAPDLHKKADGTIQQVEAILAR